MADPGLPLLLSGPIIRRQEPTFVTIWVALSKPAKVHVRVYDGVVAVPDPAATTPANITSAVIAEGIQDTIRVFDNLHLAVCAAAKGGTPFFPGTLYSYNITFELGTGTEDLLSLGLLQDYAGEEGTGAVESLGYTPGTLPSFMTAPATIDQGNHLVLVHCSCSKPHGLGAQPGDAPDAPDDRPDVAMLPDLDDYIKDRLDDPNARPHQLFLTGDQIYADDVATALLPYIDSLTAQLLGNQKEMLTYQPGAELSVELANFPAGRRQRLMIVNGFTSSDDPNHLLGLAEWAAMYLLVWSPACWNPAPDRTAAKWLKPRLPVVASPWDAGWDESLKPELARVLADRKDLNFSDTPGATPPPGVTEVLVPPAKPAPAPADGTGPELTPIFYDGVGEATPDIRKANRAHEVLADLRRNFISDKYRAEGSAEKVWKVRRALANTPTYMMLDDHEVTDDFYITAGWKDQVLTSPLGRNVVRNALVAYTLFQAWGNNPDRFGPVLGLPENRLLQAIQTLFLAGAASGPDQAAKSQVDSLLGFDALEPQVRFSYTVDGPLHRVMVMDTRTRRQYDALTVTPTLLSPQALTDLFPENAHLDAGLDLLFIVSTAQVIGPPLIDWTLLPAGVAWTDFSSAGKYGTPDPITGDPNLQPFGLYERDVEGWDANEPSLERFMARIAQYETVVILAGDVHYASSYQIDYQPASGPPARIVHFTSSPGQNAWPYEQTSVFKSEVWVTLLGSLDVPAIRMGWTSQKPLVFDASGEATTMRMRLFREPVLLPATGWATEHTMQRPPDWIWRITPVVDQRADSGRPAFAQPDPPIASDIPKVDDGGTPVNLVDGTAPLGYAQLAAVHGSSIERSWFGRGLVWGNNYGVITVSRDSAGVLQVGQELHYRRPHPLPGEDPAGFTLHVASLVPDPIVVPTSVGH